MKKSYIIGIILLICVHLLPQRVLAASEPDNDYGVPHDVYELFKRAYNNYSDKQLMSASDSLMMLYRRDRDRKYLVMAYELQHIYYYMAEDVENFDKVVEKGKALALELDMPTSYYGFCANEINFNVEVSKRMLSALQQAKELVLMAEESGDPVNQYLSTFALGQVYQWRHDWRKAFDCVTRSFDFLVNSGMDTRVGSLAEMFEMMACDMFMIHRYDKAIEYADKGIAHEKGSYVANLKFFRLASLFMQDREDEFYAQLADLRKSVQEGDELKEGYENMVHVYEELMAQNYVTALGFAQRISEKDHRLEAEELIYLRSGDYKNAHQVSLLIRDYNDSIKSQIEASDLDEIHARLNTNELEKNAIRLQNENTHLIYIGSLVLLVLVLIYTVVHTRTRKRALKKLSESNAALIEAQENERLALASTENALRRAQSALAKAEHADKMKREFISNVSHEIRTPLNAISGFTQLLLDPDLEIPREDKVVCNNQIQENTEKLTKLVNNILEISTLDTSPDTADKNLVDCMALLEGIKAHYCELKSINISMPAGRSITLHSDAERIRSILNKLMDNCIKFASEGTVTVGISLDENPGYVTIFVADQGPGIPSSMEFSIFERFKKVDEFSPGLGLGLSIAKTQAESLAGILKLDTKYQGGSRFVLILPKD